MSTVKMEGNKIVKGQRTKSNLHGWKLETNVIIDFEGATTEQIRGLAAEQALIRYRQKTGVKDLPEADAKKLLDNVTIRVAEIGKLERVKHVKSEYEKTLEQKVRVKTAAGMAIPQAFREALEEMDEEMETAEESASE